MPIVNSGPTDRSWAHYPQAQDFVNAVIEATPSVLALVQNLPRLEILEGEQIALGRGNGALPRVTVRRRPGGGIHFPDSALSLPARLQDVFPLPRPDSDQDAPEFLVSAQALLLDCQEFFAMHLTMLHWEDTIPHLPYPQDQHLRDAACHTIRQVCRQQATECLAPTLTRMQQALRGLLDTSAWHAACRATMPEQAQRDCTITMPTLRYNTAAGLGPHLASLARSNPGALGWALTHLRQEPRNHRDLTQAARQHALATGLEPQAWRRLATLPADLASETLEYSAPEDLAQAVNIMHRAGAVPRPVILQAAADMLQDCRGTLEYSQRPSDLLYRDNLHRLVLLLFRASAAGVPDADLLDQAQEVLDHARQQQEETRNTTWSGLLKAARRWHREHQERERARRERLNLQAHGETDPAPWESLLPTTQREGLTIVPLTTPEMLRQEGLSMHNCCSTYAPRCAREHRRLFSVRRTGEPRPLATGEIALRNGAWQTVQVKGYRNQPAAPEAQEAMYQTASAYQEAWQKTSEHEGQQNADNPG